MHVEVLIQLMCNILEKIVCRGIQAEFERRGGVRYLNHYPQQAQTMSLSWKHVSCDQLQKPLK